MDIKQLDDALPDLFQLHHLDTYKDKPLKKLIREYLVFCELARREFLRMPQEFTDSPSEKR